MIVLGVNGGLDLQHTNQFNWQDNLVNHDSAATLMRDGEILSCIEEERLNRIKHTNKFPSRSIEFVLRENKLSLSDIDIFAVYGNERFSDQAMRKHFKQLNKETEYINTREYIRKLLAQQFNELIDPNKIQFVDHHLAHASSAYFTSGYSDSLVLTLDGTGDGYSGMIFHGYKNQLNLLGKITSENSLGIYYLNVIHYIGLGPFDEYKAMGLAPYGNPAVFRKIFQSFYECLPQGKYIIHFQRIHVLSQYVKDICKNTQFHQVQKDIAAALQESLETIIIHILTYYKDIGGYDSLCLAGGVAHNCSANGKILYSNLFKNIFVQPAAHDAGCSLGAAVYCSYKALGGLSPQKLKHVYYGGNIGTRKEIKYILNQWSSFITWEYVDNIEKETASLIAEGHCIGWIQGRSEFGPRSLGNRSILADPRPSENKDRINAMIKKREAYRPFAPSVLLENAKEYYEFPDYQSESPYMTFVYRTKEQKVEILGAVTHIDKTARIQTVDSSVNPRYWNLINEFKKITGIPILLNTSFNNNVEPIVETPRDALVCFLTTELDALVIGNYLIRKLPFNFKNLLSLTPKLPKHVVLKFNRQYTSQNTLKSECMITYNYTQKYCRQVPEDIFKLLTQIDNETSFGEVFDKLKLAKTKENLEIIYDLWSLRAIEMYPR